MRTHLLPLLVLAACTTAPVVPHNIGGDVPRDGSGNPVFSAIRPAPPLAPAMPMPGTGPASAVAVAAEAPNVTTISDPVPVAAAPLPPTPVESCRHRRRCP